MLEMPFARRAAVTQLWFDRHDYTNLLVAMTAKSMRFDRKGGRLEADLAPKRFGQAFLRNLNLFDRAAAIAKHERCSMFVAGAGTGNKRRETRNSMDKPHGNERIKGAVDSRRFGCAFLEMRK